MNWLVEANVCPGLFYGTPAQDGFLIRIRTPGGCLTSEQGKAIATLLEQWQSPLQVTNRANLQIRGVQKSPTLEDFKTLQKLGLAAHNPSIDHLRNIMCSPTAGIDGQELIDTRPLVQEVDSFIQNHRSIAALSPKFSIGIDGGGTVGIGTRSKLAREHRYNEIQLSATVLNHPTHLTSSVGFRVALGGDKQLYDTNLLIEPKNCLAVLSALITVYLDYVQQTPSIKGKKPRMKHLLEDWGVKKYLAQVNAQFNHPLDRFEQTGTNLALPTQPYCYLGINPQKQAGLSYIGVALKLGQLTAIQLRGLVKLSETFGSNQLRLTPWQSIILPDIPQEKVSELLPKLTALGLSASKGWEAGIVACSGKPGCGKATTETQLHGARLVDYLNKYLPCHSPVNIHLTGCAKSCAQPSPAEITLLGTTFEENGEILEGYQVYIGDSPVEMLPDHQETLNPPILEDNLLQILPIIKQFLISQSLNIGNTK
ncbi:precorrin-3B synthase [Spirulina subsalsa FACHB-351]|uniref:Precorrin-3B synthase n=1 Tax=Spirulina subsalsa FACHB-351 TaxID=234711 RepID=A0ABT3LAW4_9CYAN|nr:precorrin-3B synthase [Spirulina subsalsa]MCW6038659.1 precorrin-3B synthase [Spirulina subsalsa FACHB-351]